ncbi:MAG: Lrp/AsnC family transcriptional regulator [Phycisphaerae bacterium]|nr:Lrp/AsnC family transcriptional regulator [Phycisphaerae bacterium]
MNPRDRRLIRALQDGLPHTAAPYAEAARRCGLSEDEVLQRLRAMKADGRLRRMAAIVNQRHVGLQGNVLAVWSVPDDRADAVGAALAAHAEVTHAYRRPRGTQWPYALYTMIHGPSDEACAALAAQWAEALGVTDYLLLPTVREFKKSAPVYFDDEDDEA